MDGRALVDSFDLQYTIHNISLYEAMIMQLLACVSEKRKFLKGGRDERIK